MARTVDLAITATSNSCLVKPCQFGRIDVSKIVRERLINPYTNAPYLTVATNGIFNAGDHVYLNTAGTIQEILQAGTGPIGGFALTTCTGAAGGTSCDVMPVLSGVEYIMNVTNGTTETTCTPAYVALSVVGHTFEINTATVTYAAGHPKFPLAGGTVLCSVVNMARTTVPRVLVTGIVESPELLATSTLIPVYVKFLETGPHATAFQNVQF